MNGSWVGDPGIVFLSENVRKCGKNWKYWRTVGIFSKINVIFLRFSMV